MHVPHRQFDVSFANVMPERATRSPICVATHHRPASEVVPAIVNDVDRFYKPRASVRRLFTMAGVVKYYPSRRFDRNHSFLYGERENELNTVYGNDLKGNFDSEVSFKIETGYLKDLCSRFLLIEQLYCGDYKFDDVGPMFLGPDDEFSKKIVLKRKSGYGHSLHTFLDSCTTSEVSNYFARYILFVNFFKNRSVFYKLVGYV